jgi:hypothetical protein
MLMTTGGANTTASDGGGDIDAEQAPVGVAQEALAIGSGSADRSQ